MISDDAYIQFAAERLQQVVLARGCRPLDDRQAESLAIYVKTMQEKIDDLSDRVDELEARA